MPKRQFTWSPWYHGLTRDYHYRAKIPGIRIEECTPGERNPGCTICHPELKG